MTSMLHVKTDSSIRPPDNGVLNVSVELYLYYVGSNTCQFLKQAFGTTMLR